jgi:FtsH-binding integral membrane protein
MMNAAIMTFYFVSVGLSTGPLIETVWDMDPSIVISALLYTCVVFTCFTLSALIAPDGKYLALGGPLLSILSTMLLASIINIFVRSPTFIYVSNLFCDKSHSIVFVAAVHGKISCYRLHSTFHLSMILQMQLLLGLIVMSAFVLYDTQLIMEKFRMGDKDYVWHSLTLFMDLASIFKHILVLLADKEQNSRNKKRSNSR